MSANGAETAHLIELAAAGDQDAAGRLFETHRTRLERMVRLRLDDRLQRRMDVDDVVQDVCLEASRRMLDYHRAPTMPFFVWLRFLAVQKLREHYRQHVGAQRRDVRREHYDEMRSPSSPDFLAKYLSGHLTSPSAAAQRAEIREQLATALSQMTDTDREVLVLRHFDQLSGAEVAAELRLDRSAASKRYVRALHRLKAILRTCGGGTDELH